MAQILVRNIPDEVKARLKRRAELHKRSLEEEVREILALVPEPERKSRVSQGIGTVLAKKFAAQNVPIETWDDFDDGMAQLRRSWSLRDVKL